MSVLNGSSAADMEVWCEKTIDEARESSVKHAAEHLLIVYRQRGKEIERLQGLLEAKDELLSTPSYAAANWRKRAYEAEAERDALLQQRRDWLDDEARGRTLVKLQEELNAMRAERDALLADAERYRWLRQVDRCEAWENLLMVRPITRTEDIDAAIDAARGKDDQA